MRQFTHFINGKWIPGRHFLPNINPSDTADVVGHVAQADEEETQWAIDAACRAFDRWSVSTPQQRFDVLDRTGNAILERKDELGDLLAREEGKTLAEAIGEVTRAAQVFKFFAGEALRLNGDVLPSVRAGLTVEVTREPLGVIGLITPWNFPIAIPAWKIAPALAYGNCVVLKPAAQAPASAWELIGMIEKAGAPPGVVNLVMGPGSVVGAALVKSPLVAAVSFTGSVATGRDIGRTCFDSGKRIQLEMGGKNPMVVLDDADLDIAIEASLNGAFFSAGQRCTASSRLIVTAGIHDRFVAGLTERVRALKVGDARQPGTQIGPVVDAVQLRQVEAYLDVARGEGAEIHGGERVTCLTDGHFLAPALVTGTTNSMRINREEVFGPVATIIRAADYQDALAIANDTEFGLSAGICTTSLTYSTHFRRHAQAGMVMVNTPTAGVDYHVPFGGRKGSSYGPREQGAYAREFYTTIKTAYINPGDL
ncbi:MULTISPECIES: aldehyde dehydrogenase family protein [Burkholderia]|uniref:aldehyde dehydrogenase family protein n=1 Tax=Burkholderia TaxID=32008 RepID=UPI000758AC40|nr:MULTISPECIES: aldehyde dehydrogenase family protein [Burkholderia]AOJ68833.1 aldehyde dehydrogenase [Burkholderia savannae]KVG45702.1 aldehyde dehydrogenase [Burkholderia sp. MSMB0265]KVG87677.1 aldehyde dehydrogenase [Burkholderia sp. MSMB2040]KVG99089.1 aldehyde dehydrogenase [Burkholderia sp. MSMB2042]KVG99609.1 aldehyde dehydrogenase [Burkholderia sp. MSMB2041]